MKIEKADLNRGHEATESLIRYLEKQIDLKSKMLLTEEKNMDMATLNNVRSINEYINNDINKMKADLKKFKK